MNTITQASVASLLRFDEETQQLHWLKAPRGKKADQTRAGWDVKARDSVRRVLKIEGALYDHDAIKALLLTGSMPERSRRKTRKATKRSSTIASTAPEVVAPIATPAELPEVARAVVAAAKPEHRGWLVGLGLRRAA